MKLDYEICDVGAENLCVAVIGRAANDYVILLRRKRPNEAELAAIKELERFFLSSWGQWLSHDNGETVMRRCRESAKRKRKGWKVCLRKDTTG